MSGMYGRRSGGAPLQTRQNFFGRNRYPDCTFVAWARPVAEKCPDCGNPYLVEKYLKAGAFLQCPASGCKYKREFQPADAEPVAS